MDLVKTRIQHGVEFITYKKRPVLNIKRISDIINFRIPVSYECRRISRQKWKILQTDKFKCRWCDHNEYLTIDHIKYPEKEDRAIWYRDGEYQVLCVDCHEQKNNTLKLFRCSQLYMLEHQKVYKEEELIAV